MLPDPADPPQPAAPGTMIVVVGPSGAGKDTLINLARERLGSNSAVLFVRRIVTRKAVVTAEDHESLEPKAFMEASAEGRFAAVWEAHGLAYAIPQSARAHVEAGGVAVVNGSRAALPLIRTAFARVVAVQITARPEILAARLRARGREPEAEIAHRLRRAENDAYELGDSIAIDNSSSPEIAAEALICLIRASLPAERGTP